MNTIKHADRVLMGMTGWEFTREPGDDREAAAKAAKAAATRDRASPNGYAVPKGKRIKLALTVSRARLGPLCGITPQYRRAAGAS